MRKFILLTTLILAAAATFAEETPKEPKGVSPEVKDKINKAKDRVLLEFSLSQLLNKPSDLKVSGFSRGFNAYFTYDVVLGKSRFSIAPGAGIGTDNFYHKGNSIKWHKDTVTTFPQIGDSISVKKSKLGLTYFDIPLEFRFRSKQNKKNTSWKLAAGFKVGFLLASKWKYKGENFDNSGENIKTKDFNVANLNKIRYGVYLRGGYGMFNVFCYYSISSLFQKDKGPQMHPLTFGLAITGL
jgi:Outer membrane protein beta-barrel domain